MLRMAASWRAWSASKESGAFRYSSRARRTQHSIVATLFSTTSLTIDAASFENIVQQGLSCLVQCRFVAEKRRIVQGDSVVLVPPAGTGKQYLALHDRRGGAEVQQVDIATRRAGQLIAEVEQCHLVNVALYQYGEVRSLLSLPWPSIQGV